MEETNRATPKLVNTNVNISQIKRFVIIILISLTVIQKVPFVRDLYYEQIRLILYLLFGIFGFVSLPVIKKYYRFRLIRLFFFVLVYVFFLNLVAIIVGNYNTPFLDLLIPFGILVCSLNTEFKRVQLNQLLLLYAGLVSLMAINSIFYYGEGFTITQLNMVPTKNQIGPMMGIAAIILFVSIFDPKQLHSNTEYVPFKLVLLISIIASLIATRNRAGMVSLLIISVLFLIKEYRPKRSLKNILTVLVLSIVFSLLFRYGILNNLLDIIWKSLTLNHDYTDLNSLSAGRIEGYKLALDYISQHPIVGALVGGIDFNYIPHNYILFNWQTYGLVGSIPMVGFYLYLFYSALKNSLFNNIKQSFSLPYWVLLFSLLVSIVEYTYPFGPGVSQLMLWFLIGQHMKIA